MTPRACAVIGSPIGHSRSPQLHRAAYAEFGLDWTYTRRDVPAGGLAQFVNEVGERGLDGLPCGGLSVTMPGKAEALAHAELSDERATALGAANTLIPVHEAGRITGWHAHNTDVDGIMGALAEHDVEAAGGRRCLVIGAGGTAAAAIAAFAALGAREVEVVARNHDRAASVVGVGERFGVHVSLAPWDDVLERARIAELLVSTVPPGAADVIGAARFRSGQVVLDAVYAGGSTALLHAARRAGATAIDGVWMLLHQAVEQVWLMTGRRPSVDVMRAALG